MAGSYCLLSLKKSHVSHHIIFIRPTACVQNVGLQHERKPDAKRQQHIQ